MRRLASSSLVLLAACGASEPAGDPDAALLPPVADAAGGTVFDARPPAPDAATADCPDGLPESFGNLGAATANKNFIGEHHNVFIDLADDERWFFAMNLHPGRGIFAGGVVPGTYELTGPDTDYQYCAACLNLFARYPEEHEDYSLHMFPGKGTLVITSVQPDGDREVSGYMEDVYLQAIKIVYDDEGDSCSAPGNSAEDPACVNTLCLGPDGSENCGRQVVLAGCSTSIARMSF